MQVIIRVGCIASSSLYASSLLRVTSRDNNKRSETGEKSNVLSQAPRKERRFLFYFPEIWHNL
jgi:hypothetical protein